MPRGRQEERPQGTFMGLQMGAKADRDLYMSGFFRAMVMAPWPPMECPMIPVWSRPGRGVPGAGMGCERHDTSSL